MQKIKRIVIRNVLNIEFGKDENAKSKVLKAIKKELCRPGHQDRFVQIEVETLCERGIILRKVYHT